MIQVKSFDKEILAVTFKKSDYNHEKRAGTLGIKFSIGVSCVSKTKSKEKLGKRTQ